jgi:hypothetical protein
MQGIAAPTHAGHGWRTQPHGRVGPAGPNGSGKVYVFSLPKRLSGGDWGLGRRVPEGSSCRFLLPKNQFLLVNGSMLMPSTKSF